MNHFNELTLQLQFRIEGTNEGGEEHSFAADSLTSSTSALACIHAVIPEKQSDLTLLRKVERNHFTRGITYMYPFLRETYTFYQAHHFCSYR